MPQTEEERARAEFWIDAFLRGLSSASLDWNEYEPESLAKEACHYASEMADRALELVVARGMLK